MKRPKPVLLRLPAILLAATLAAAGCYEKSDYRSPTEENRQFLQLTVAGGARSLPADGVSRLTLVATITADAAVGRRTVKFKTTAGKLIGPGTMDQEKDIEADQSGRAAIELQSSKQVSTALVTAEIALGTGAGKLVDRQEIAFTVPDGDAIVRFVAAAGSAPADGASPSRFTVEVSDRIPADARSVVFTTTAGSFARGASTLTSTVALGADRQATVTLFSPQELGSAEVSARINDFSASSVIEFVPAIAERILIALSAASVKNSIAEKITITATLDRTVGIPTKETQVFFTVTDVTGAERGHFLQTGFLSGADGKVTADYTPAGLATVGTAKVVVTAQDSPARAEARFEIVAP